MRDNTRSKSGTGVSGIGVSGTGVSGTGVSGTGVPPVKGVTSFIATRRNLPHWEEPGSVYFITWNTIKKTCLTPEERTLTLSAIRYWDNTRWALYTAVVMPDHVHVLAQPLKISEEQPPAWYKLGSILHSVKSYSAHQINRLRKQAGAVWQDERKDRTVRNEKEFWGKWQYVRDNPVKGNLAVTSEEYLWFYQQMVTGGTPVPLL